MELKIFFSYFRGCPHNYLFHYAGCLLCNAVALLYCIQFMIHKSPLPLSQETLPDSIHAVDLLS